MGDEITSLSGITDGTMFIISDGTNAKYFYTNNESENAVLASIPADAYFYFTLEAYEGGDVDNAYYIKITNANGESYPRGTNSGPYLNAILNFGTLVISAEKEGWSNAGHEQKDALWYVTYTADQGFSFKNVYRSDNSGGNGSKFWLAIGNDFVDSQQYLKLYSKPNDPLAEDKAALSAKITRAKMYNAFAYTAASFEDLTDEITTAEEALAAAVSKESLNTATTNLQAKIDALVMKDGYTNLTTDMFKEWDSNTVPTTGSSTGCAYTLYQPTGQPYGDTNVFYKKFADISDFSSMSIIAPAGTPRIMLNRQVPIDPGAEGYDVNGGAYVQITDAPVDDKVTVDLTVYDYAHLNAIKGANWADVTVTGMYLYRTITVGEKGLATFGSLTKNAKPNGVKAYAAVYNSVTGKVDLEEVTNVPAGKGVIIEAVEGSYAPTFDVAAADIESDLKVSNGTVVGDGKTIYVLNKVGGNVGFYKLAKDSPVGAGKAYLVIPETNARGFIGVDGMELTGVNEVNVNKAVAKTGKIYNLNGQIVSRPTKGLYIIDGKVVSF